MVELIVVIVMIGILTALLFACVVHGKGKIEAGGLQE